MLNFLYENDVLISVSPVFDVCAINRNDFCSLAHAELVALQATALTGRLHIATDAGAYVSPRYDVIEAPKVGEPVSQGFNGDYYPAGVITKVSKSLRRIETSEGLVFFRRGSSATWLNGRTWSMVSGHVSARNPSF